VNELLDRVENERSWIDAYEVEQLLVNLFDDHTLTTELGLRILEAKSVLRPALAGWYEERADKDPSGSERTLLARLVNDLQWRYTVNEVKRRYTNEITRNCGWLFIAALGIFVVLRASGPLMPDAQDAWRLGIVAAAGFWGASFSMIIGLKERLEASELDALKVMRSKWLLVARALIGVGAALILYFFLQSGVLAGSAFPTIDDGSALEGKALGLLIAWSFLAGFSEKLVPSLLAKTEEHSETRPPLSAPVASAPVAARLDAVETDSPKVAAAATEGKQNTEA
jgi:hypothetical protein